MSIFFFFCFQGSETYLSMLITERQIQPLRMHHVNKSYKRLLRSLNTFVHTSKQCKMPFFFFFFFSYNLRPGFFPVIFPL